MLTNDELKKKIAQIIAEYCCPLGKTHKQLYGAERQCYTEMNFAECKPITECTDALIAAGGGEVNWKLECQTCAKAKCDYGWGLVLPCDEDKCEPEAFKNTATTSSIPIKQYQSNKTVEVEKCGK